MDDVEESEEDIDGDDFEGVKDNCAGLHVVGAGEAGSRLQKICSGNERLDRVAKCKIFYTAQIFQIKITPRKARK